MICRGTCGVCMRRVVMSMPEDGFDPGPDTEDDIPWDVDRDSE